MNLEQIKWAFEFSRGISKGAAETIDNAVKIVEVIHDVDMKYLDSTLNGIWDTLASWAQQADMNIGEDTDNGNDRKEYEEFEKLRRDIRP